MCASRWLKAACRNPWRARVSRKPHRFISSSHSDATESVSIRVGGNGYVDLNIYAPQHATIRQNILIHLPQSSCLSSYASYKPDQVVRKLKDALPTTTIVDVGYRLSPRTEKEDNRFPTPVHDVFAAWDYLCRYMRPSIAHRDHHNSPSPRICVYGNQIGGALALALALTEPNNIHAIAIQDPLVDWPVLEELASYTPSSSATRKQSSKSLLQNPDFQEARSEAAKGLIKLRTSLFATPSAYFDSFASPTLFLRAPGRDTPLTKTAAPEEDNAVLAGEPIRYGEDESDVGFVTTEAEQGGFGPYDDDFHAMSSSTISARPNTVAEVPGATIVSRAEPVQVVTDLSYWQPEEKPERAPNRPRRRKVLRKWPPNTHPEDVLLPRVNIVLHEPDSGSLSTAGILPVTYTQGLELVDLLRRACFWGREKSFAEERVVLTKLEHGSGDEMQHEINPTVVEWLRERFEESSA